MSDFFRPAYSTSSDGRVPSLTAGLRADDGSVTLKYQNNEVGASLTLAPGVTATMSVAGNVDGPDTNGRRFRIVPSDSSNPSNKIVVSGKDITLYRSSDLTGTQLKTLLDAATTTWRTYGGVISLGTGAGGRSISVGHVSEPSTGGHNGAYIAEATEERTIWVTTGFNIRIGSYSFRNNGESKYRVLGQGTHKLYWHEGDAILMEVTSGTTADRNVAYYWEENIR